ncbi:hypothetical protein ONZ45_g1351 [Pleurotus djamor]|nr:hypothetical protein ONZ45_g1351 [Pleurotus djamor]
MDDFRKFEFSTPSLLNTTIIDESDRYYYEVVTPDSHPFITTIQKLDLVTGTFVPVAEILNTSDSRCKPIMVKLLGEPESEVAADDYVAYDEKDR